MIYDDTSDCDDDDDDVDDDDIYTSNYPWMQAILIFRFPVIELNKWCFIMFSTYTRTKKKGQVH